MSAAAAPGSADGSEATPLPEAGSRPTRSVEGQDSNPHQRSLEPAGHPRELPWGAGGKDSVGAQTQNPLGVLHLLFLEHSTHSPGI